MNTKKHAVSEALLAGLLADYKKPEDLIGENGLLKQLTKLLVEKALDADLSEHLGYCKNEPVANEAGNTRNGKRCKMLKDEFGELPIEIPGIGTTFLSRNLFPSTRHAVLVSTIRFCRSTLEA
jgi:putative transposase